MFLRCLHVYPDFFGHVGTWLDKKAKFNFKIYDVTDWTQIIAIHIVTNTSRNEYNQVIKFGQLIENYLQEYSSSTIMKKMKQGHYLHTSFCLFKKLYKASGQHLGFNIFW